MDEKQVVELMQSSNTAEQWNNNIETVKKAFGGQYPSFWFGAIVTSGIANATAQKWGGSDKLHFERIR